MFIRSRTNTPAPRVTSFPEIESIPTFEGKPFKEHRAKLSLVPTPDARDRSLVTAQALLGADEEQCRALNLLPPGYYGEDLDHEEFFRPADALAKGVEDAHSLADQGLLEDPADRPEPRSYLVSEAIDATIAEMHRAFDHNSGPSARPRFQLACRDELVELAAELAGEPAKEGARVQ